MEHLCFLSMGKVTVAFVFEDACVLDVLFVLLNEVVTNAVLCCDRGKSGLKQCQRC